MVLQVGPAMHTPLLTAFVFASCPPELWWVRMFLKVAVVNGGLASGAFRAQQLVVTVSQVPS